VEEFTMPVKVTTAPGKMELIYPNTKKYQTIDVVGLHPDDFSVAEDQYLVDVRIWKTILKRGNEKVLFCCAVIFQCSGIFSMPESIYF
jgi:hypothetical protein